MRDSSSATTSTLTGPTGAVGARSTRPSIRGVVTSLWRTPSAARARPGRPILVAVVLLGMLAGGTGFLLLGQAQGRHALEDRFALRAALGSTFVAAYVADIIAREQTIGSELLGADLVDADDFDRVVQTFGFEAAILLDSDGTLLHAAPAAPHLVGIDLTQKYEHFRLAVAGVPAVSNAVASAAEGRPIVGFAAPFETAHGQRVLSGGYYLGETPLSAYLNSAIPFATASAYLIDGNGVIIETNSDVDAVLTPLASADPALSVAIAERNTGTYRRGSTDDRFVVAAIDATSFRLVLTVPGEQLYAPLQGPMQWVPWVLLATLGIGAFYLLRVHTALGRAQVHLRAAGEELERSNRDLADFASVASHDLQEPLRKIQTFGDRLSAKYSDKLGDGGLDYLDRMTSAATRMRGLIEDLLSYSRVAKGAQRVRQVPLAPLVDEVLTDLERRIDETSARVSVDELPVIDADPLQMRQLFQNLIANGLKFVSPGTTPEIRVWAERVAAGPPHSRGTRANANSAWRILVADNGIGFGSQYLERVFAPFQRLHGRSEYEGSGMGLAICRRIAERHGGDITATSEIGKGSTFIITLPERQPGQRAGRTV